MSLAASDKVAVLVFRNGDNGGPDDDIVERDGEFSKVPDMISFANSDGQKNLTYTSLQDLLRYGVTQDDERHSVGVADNDASPLKHVGDDDDYSHGSIE